MANPTHESIKKSITAEDEHRIQRITKLHELKTEKLFKAKVGPEQEKQMAEVIKEINSPSMKQYLKDTVKAMSKLEKLDNGSDEMDEFFANDPDAKKVRQGLPAFSKWYSKMADLVGTKYNMDVPKYPVPGFTNTYAQYVKFFK